MCVYITAALRKWQTNIIGPWKTPLSQSFIFILIHFSNEGLKLHSRAILYSQENRQQSFYTQFQCQFFLSFRKKQLEKKDADAKMQLFNADSFIMSHSLCCSEWVLLSLQTLFMIHSGHWGQMCWIYCALHPLQCIPSLHSTQHAVTLNPFSKTSLLKRCEFVKWANRTWCHRESWGKKKPLHQSWGLNSEWQFVTEECHWGRIRQETHEQQQSNQP